MSTLDGKVAIITGASGGLGKATAELFSSLGAKLVLTDINGETVSAVAAALPDAIAITQDVSNEASWNDAVTLAISTYGQLDILVNNAGIDFSESLLETSLELFDLTIRVNQTGCFLGMKAAAKVMAEGGSIINISSMAGLQGLPGKIAYSASKFAVRGMTKVAALELAHKGIRVNSVHPGGINTPMLGDPEALKASGAVNMVPLKRVAEPVEIAKTIAFLGSDDASYSTGSEFVVDGGIMAGPSF